MLFSDIVLFWFGKTSERKGVIRDHHGPSSITEGVPQFVS